MTPGKLYMKLSSEPMYEVFIYIQSGFFFEEDRSAALSCRNVVGRVC